ncbi:unnamed protein product [Fusarium graminearum]|nr:unnamed protein product [Fusarium graminearum]
MGCFSLKNTMLGLSHIPLDNGAGRASHGVSWLCVQTMETVSSITLSSSTEPKLKLFPALGLLSNATTLGRPALHCTSALVNKPYNAGIPGRRR